MDAVERKPPHKRTRTTFSRSTQDKAVSAVANIDAIVKMCGEDAVRNIGSHILRLHKKNKGNRRRLDACYKKNAQYLAEITSLTAQIEAVRKENVRLRNRLPNDEFSAEFGGAGGIKRYYYRFKTKKHEGEHCAALEKFGKCREVICYTTLDCFVKELRREAEIDEELLAILDEDDEDEDDADDTDDADDDVKKTEKKSCFLNVERAMSAGGRTTDYSTPFNVWKDIAPRIHDFVDDKKVVLYDPFYCDGRAGTFLRSLFPEHEIYHENEDFYAKTIATLATKQFKTAKTMYDLNDVVIITNPPFENLATVMRVIRGLNVPFFMLVSAKKISTHYLNELFGTTLQVIIPTRKYNFIDKHGAQIKGNGLECAWITYKTGQPRDVAYIETRTRTPTYFSNRYSRMVRVLTKLSAVSAEREVGSAKTVIKKFLDGGEGGSRDNAIVESLYAVAIRKCKAEGVEYSKLGVEVKVAMEKK